MTKVMNVVKACFVKCHMLSKIIIIIKGDSRAESANVKFWCSTSIGKKQSRLLRCFICANNKMIVNFVKRLTFQLALCSLQ